MTGPGPPGTAANRPSAHMTSPGDLGRRMRASDDTPCVSLASARQ